jgi:N-acetylglucosaminyldiphosphoundecaprenol N-acetyl-beta-D-mannosaminyltransferase
VGRCEGKMSKDEEPAVIEAIRKSSPNLLLAGTKIRGEELWIARNTQRLNAGFRLWCSDLFEVFADKKRHPSEAVFEMGLENAGLYLRNPLKVFRVFLYIYYLLQLLFCRLFKNR